MSANHNTLGFAQEMPGTTGDVQVVTPAAEQLTELQKKAHERAETAGNVSAMLDELPGGLDANVKDFVIAANEDAERTGVLDGAIVADEVAIDDILHSEGPHTEVASMLGKQLDEPLKEALEDTVITEGEDAARQVLEDIGAAEAAADEAQLGSVTLQQLRAEIANKKIDVVDRKLWGSEIQELSNDLQATRCKNLAACAEEQMTRTGVENPNSHSKGLFIGDPEDGVPMHENSAYRTVDIRAIVDLIDTGVVRGAYTATGGERSQTESHTAHWSDGEEGRHHRFKSDGAFTIEAPKEVLDAGWVTADKVTGVYTRGRDGRLVNLLESQAPQDAHTETKEVDVSQRELVEVNLDEIKQKLAECGGDSSKLVDAIAAYMKIDSQGRCYSLDPRGLCELVNAVPMQRPDILMSGEHAESLKYMVTLMSTMEINNENGVLGAHMKALRMLEVSEGSAPLQWRSKIRAGESVSEAARNYADKPFLACAVMVNLEAETSAKMDTHIFIKEKIDAAKRYKSGAAEAIRYVLDTERNPDLEWLSTAFMKGDIKDYGFSGKEGGIRTINQTGHIDILRFVTNVDAVGREGVAKLHNELGTVNIGAYSSTTLRSMLHIIEHPEAHRDKGVSAILRGVNGDYNAAFYNLTAAHDLENTLCLEIGQLSDVQKANDLLDRLDVPLNRLTIAGHGGRAGIHISRTAILRRDVPTVSNPIFRRLLGRIVPDESGARNVILNSCSQGRDYDSQGSMAQIISTLDTGTTVTAAPDVSYTTPSTSRGEFTVSTNAYYGLGKFAETHGSIPGLTQLSKFLLESDRVRKLGVVRVSNGQKTVDNSGKIYIGA